MASTPWSSRQSGCSSLASRSLIFYKNSSSSFCNACQLGKHTRLPFSVSRSMSKFAFEIIHADLWTSPVLSFTGFKYYLVLLDDFTHYTWTFPLRAKSDVSSIFISFCNLVRTHFNASIKHLQCDNGGEFQNSTLSTFFSTYGILPRYSCPHTSQQNGHAERMIRTLTNMIRSLLFHAHVPLVYWVEALHTATHLINLLPTSRLNFLTPHEALFRSAPDFSHLHVFGCLCYPNVSATAPHKLSPRSIPCVFIGYPSSHKGFRCLDLATGKVIISRHVVFYELSFPFAPSSSSSSAPSSASRRVSLADVEDNSPLLLSPPRPPINSPSPAPRPSHLRPKSVPPGFPSSPSPADSGPTLSGSNCPAIPNPGPSSSGPNTSPRGPLSSPNPTASSPAPASPPPSSCFPSNRSAHRSPAPPDADQLGSPVPVGDSSSLVPINESSSIFPVPDSSSIVPITDSGSVSSPPPAPPLPPSSHPMTTRSKAGIFKPKTPFSFSTVLPFSLSPLPRTYSDALKDPNWREAMIQE